MSRLSLLVLRGVPGVARPATGEWGAHTPRHGCTGEACPCRGRTQVTWDDEQSRKRREGHAGHNVWRPGNVSEHSLPQNPPPEPLPAQQLCGRGSHWKNVSTATQDLKPARTPLAYAVRAPAATARPRPGPRAPPPHPAPAGWPARARATQRRSTPPAALAAAPSRLQGSARHPIVLTTRLPAHHGLLLTTPDQLC
jgi:hypothetical protein